jgi:hypothetical protein
MVIQALKMEGIIKRQEIMIERLKTDKDEDNAALFLNYATESMKQLELFRI